MAFFVSSVAVMAIRLVAVIMTLLMRSYPTPVTAEMAALAFCALALRRG